MDLDLFLKETVAKSTQQQGFYHFTDRSNLPLIRANVLISTSGLKSANLFNKVKTGGDALSLQSDLAKGTDKYVCLCFRPNHPMAHIAMNDDRKLDPVYLEIDPAVVKLPGVMITSAPSNQNGVERIAKLAATSTPKATSAKSVPKPVANKLPVRPLKVPKKTAVA